MQVNRINHVIVSTEDEEIASISRGLGVEVPFMRPNHLAVDQAQSAPVVIDALYRMEEINNIKYDAVLMLQPTSPLRTSKHIEKALDLFFSQECDSVVSVVSVGGTHPFRMKRLVDDRLVNYIDQGHEDMRPRQELPQVYIRNGAIYATLRDVLIDGDSFVGENSYPYVMSKEKSINIDTLSDLYLAQTYINNAKNKL